MRQGLVAFSRPAACAAAVVALFGIGGASANDAVFEIAQNNSRQIPGAMVGGSSSSALGDMTLRVDRAESQMRALNGQVEELTFQIRQLQEQLRRMQEDNEFRFQALEQARGKKRSDAAPAARDTSIATAPAEAPPAQADADTGFTDGAPPVDLGPIAEPPPEARTADGSSAATGAPPTTLGTLSADAVAGTYDPNAGPLDLTAMTTGGIAGGAAAATAPAPAGSAGLPGVAAAPLPELATASDAKSPPPPGTQVAAIAGGSTARELYDNAYNFVLRGDYPEAEAGFRRFLAAYPNDRLAADAEYWLGESLYARSDYRASAQAFLKSYSEYPDSRKAPDALLKLGLSLAGMGEKGAACASFAELLQRYPQASTPLKDRVRAEQKSAKC
jgi:tol-pal system protein YbgF